MTTPQGIIYTHVERDPHLRWHPVIVIKQRGMQVFAATGLQGYMSREQAEREAAKEAQRLEKGR